MIFNSFEFAVFLVLVLGLYRVLGHTAQNRMLLAASYVFYGWWNWKFLSLIILSTLLDYYCGSALDRTSDPRRRRWLVTLSLAGNLGVLALFKYFNFFAENAEALLAAAGLSVDRWVLDVVLPVGISFYTFQTLSYTLDIYRGQLRPARRFLDFALFVAFFPQLVAGPIERASRLLPQIERRRVFDRAQFFDGGWLIFWGLFKKVVLADNAARFVDPVYGAPGEYSAPWVLLATYAFAVQIYCDFSGYTDIARGVAKTLGFELSLNFNLPYFAKSPQDFWRRWHISLSQWLRDYLYIPLGGNRGSRGRILANLMVTMALGGLWHGAAWPFVLWGIYHGLLLILYRLAGSRTEGRAAGETGARGSRTGNALRILGMFHLTCLGWLLFRARSLGDIGTMLRAFVTDWRVTPDFGAAAGSVLGYGAVLLGIQLFQYRSGNLMIVRKWPVWVRALLYFGLYLGLTLGGRFDGRAFIYFQF